MKKILCMLMTAGLLMSTVASVAALEQKDNPQCKDHPLFSRMPTYWIRSCANKEFDSHAFFVGKDPATGKVQTEAVEGQVWDISYYPQADATSKPSELQILRNFENAMQKEGGSVVASDKNRETFKLTKDGKEYWVEVSAEFTGKYRLFVVRKQGMTQDVAVNAETLSKDIRSTGHVAVYGIYFDTGKSTIKPESADAIKEIAKLLQADANLKVHVVGHTDNVGGISSNMTLSQSRAEAVQKSLVSEHGITADRLTAHGCGQFAPVASNDAEDGRAKNRRVELVKQ
jgi:outer membrane protein OmpA-like peptidoglycan-associated protein